MKEEKVGKKPKGMVVVNSVGKPGGKKPEREADPDTKKKADFRDLQRSMEKPEPKFEREAELYDMDYAYPHSKDPYDPLGMEIMSESFQDIENLNDKQPLNQLGTGYNRRMMVDDLHTDTVGGLEPGIPFEDPHMELRLDHEERELDRLQGFQGDSPNIRPRLHPLHGSKPSRPVDIPDPQFADEPERIPAFSYRELPYSFVKPLDPNNEIITHEGQRYEKIPRGMRRNPNYGRTMQRPQKYTVQQRRGAEGIIQRSEDDDILSDILKGDLSNVDFCDCCSIMENTFALMKAKKKAKPFHGYNPKRHHKKGGLNQAGRDKFKRETGANLKPPVTTKPSKLKPGSKKAKRRKSFCARMSGSKGPTSKKGKLTPKGAALKRWNC